MPNEVGLQIAKTFKSSDEVKITLVHFSELVNANHLLPRTNCLAQGQVVPRQLFPWQVMKAYSNGP